MSGASNGPVRLVCFDWGGVILKHCRSWEEACAVAGLPVREGCNLPHRIARRREVTRAYQCGELAPEEFFQALAAAGDHQYTPGEIELLHEAWITEEYEGIAAVIERLVSLPSIETAMLSNTNHAHWQRQLGPGRRGPRFPTAALLKHRHASHLLGHVKPGEEIYRAFEQQTGYRGGEILFFDDLAENIATAVRIGWRGELIDHTGDTAAQVTNALIRHRVFTPDR